MKQIQTLVERMKSLGSADPQTVFSELYEFFLGIGTLGKEEVFAAYKAVEFYKAHLPEPIGEYTKDLLEEVQSALINRARVIYQEIDPSKRAGLAFVFSRNLGGDCLISFLNIDDASTRYVKRCAR